MKKLLYIIAGIFIMGTGTANAQKVGHVNSQEILFALPDYKKAEAEMKKFTEERMAEYEKMKAKLEAMISEYERIKPTASATELKIKEQDIISYQNDIANFEQTYQNSLEKRQQMYMEPLVKQVKDAIAKVAKAQGLNYILDINSLLFMDGGNDITEAVKKDLGLGVVPTTPATPAKTGGK